MTTIEIPGEYAHWVRLAGLRLLKDDSACVADLAAETTKAIVDEAFHSRSSTGQRKSLDHHFSDLRGGAMFLAQVIPVVLQLGEGKGVVESTPEPLAYLVDSLARHVLADELRNADGPFDNEGEIRTILGALDWAEKEGNRLVREGGES